MKEFIDFCVITSWKQKYFREKLHKIHRTKKEHKKIEDGAGI